MSNAAVNTRADTDITRRPLAPAVPLHRMPSLILAMQRNIIPIVQSLTEQLGSTIRLSAPGMDMVFITRAEDAERVLVAKQDIYSKGREYAVPALGLRTGLVTSTGKRWERDRKMLNPMFAKRHLVPFAATMAQCTLNMTERWESLPDGSSPDIADEMMRVTLDIAAETLFGTHLAEAEIAEIGPAIGEILKDMFVVGASPITWLMQALPGISLASAAGAHWRARRIRQRVAEMDGMVRGHISAREHDPNRPTDDFLAMLLAARGDDRTISDQEVMAQSLTFLGAGHETTASGLAWFWHLLSENPGARAKMLDEIDTVLGGRTPTAADVDNLPWTKACFSEALRLHPPVYISMRSAHQDDVLDGYRIEAGTIVVVLTREVHRDPVNWPDPNRFDPDRFSPALAKARPRGAYLPFGGGRRICIGSQFAVMEGALIAAIVGQRYVLDPAPGWRVQEEGATSLRPKGGLPMVLRRRKDAPAIIGESA